MQEPRIERSAEAGAYRVRRCLCCTHGKIEEWVSGHVSGFTPCAICDGTGLAPDHRRAGQPSVEIVNAEIAA